MLAPDERHANRFIDPSLEALIPADTVFIVGAGINAIQNTPVYPKLLSKMELLRLNQFTRHTGIDPRRPV